MSRIYFTQATETYWFDPETGEYHYDGPDALLRAVLENMTAYSEVQTSPLFGVADHPGEETIPLSPEERRGKVVNYLAELEGVEVHYEREGDTHRR